MNNNPVGRGFGHPVDLAVHKDGRILVLNRHDVYARVGVCTLDEEYLGEFGSYGHGRGQFWLPTAVTIDNRGRVYVADEYHHNVTIFDESGNYVDTWGQYGTDKGKLNGPSGLAVDEDNNVYVVDQKNDRVHKFTSDGRHILQWGESGSKEGQFNLPWGLTLDAEGMVYVADWRNDRIQKFTGDGEFIASFGESGEAPGQFHRPTSVAVGKDGMIYVADWGNNRVQIFDEHGDLIQVLKGDSTLSKWAEDFFAANPDEKELRDISQLVPDLPSHLDTPDHVSSQTEPFFWGPVSVGLDYQSRLHVVETNRHRIQIYGGT